MCVSMLLAAGANPNVLSRLYVLPLSVMHLATPD